MISNAQPSIFPRDLRGQVLRGVNPGATNSPQERRFPSFFTCGSQPVDYHFWCRAARLPMFFRVKPAGPRRYLQIVENHWIDGRSRQRVVATLGRLDHLQQDGRLESLLASGARYAQQALLLTSLHNGQLDSVRRQRFGAVAIFERLWREAGCDEVIR